MYYVKICILKCVKYTVYMLCFKYKEIP